MNWKQWMSRFDWKNKRDLWLFLMVLGMIFMIMATPVGKKTSDAGKIQTEHENKIHGTGNEDEVLESGSGTSEEGLAAAGKAMNTDSYEVQMENRVRELLKHVEGVGTADVMIVLKSSEETVWHMDTNTSVSSTSETDSSGGSRQVDDQEVSQTTILSGSGDRAGTPVIEKELKPEVEGVVISAAGGGSPAVQAEITQAMEALFGIPSHKIKILKRVE